ncbi:cat eye syndrome critical region protein 2 homolog [Eurytemora carolleeae]|uniref:cat eye syndrome critical region protein 2 homolog n=1 Tax=Eurytemora carolleeae TaxID=1294199 RepID=UPI000C780B38|nr:cat eye syndrome critical region protein 2 homolog [Eurytemora carolleeae]|eukprot:XP_023322122.1 cat eye syndrome critical region protein 2 homolog [Eurytemora affinis]
MSFGDVQNMREIPSIAYFCSLFHETLGTMDFDIQDLENALVLGVASQDMFAGGFLDSLVTNLLQGCVPSLARTISSTNYSIYLRKLLNSELQEYQEESFTDIAPLWDPFDENTDSFSDLSIPDKARVILQLTELRLQADDVSDKIKDVPVESLRLEPLGQDSEGVVYWYFYGTRLYKEVPKKRKKTKDKTSDSNDNGKTKKKKTKVEDEEETEDLGPPGWYLACRTEQDWTDLTDRLGKSKKKTDKELCTTLQDNFIPEVVKMFQKQERDEKIKLLMMNKRSSSRIDRKKKAQEEREEKEREKEDALRREEEQRARLEKENASKSRALRVQSREEKLVRPPRESSAEPEPRIDREQRILQREQKRTSQGNEYKTEQGKRTRLDIEMRRREVELDHDYWKPGSRSRKPEGGQKPVSREWNRLLNAEEETQPLRSIRF